MYDIMRLDAPTLVTYPPAVIVFYSEAPMGSFLIWALFASLWTAVSDESVQNLEDDADAWRQSLTIAQTTQQHTAQAAVFVQQAVPALAEFHRLARECLLNLEKAVQDGASSDSPESLRWALAAAKKSVAALQEALQANAFPSSSSCTIPPEIAPTHVAQDVQPMLASLATSCQEAESTRVSLLHHAQALLGRLAVPEGHTLASRSLIAEGASASDSEITAWKSVLQQRLAFLQTDGHAPLLANRVQASLASCGPSEARPFVALEDLAPSLEVSAEPEEGASSVFALQRSAIAERYLHASAQEPRCSQMASQLITPVHSAAHERLFLQFLSCSEGQ